MGRSKQYLLEQTPAPDEYKDKKGLLHKYHGPSNPDIRKGDHIIQFKQDPDGQISCINRLLVDSVKRRGKVGTDIKTQKEISIYDWNGDADDIEPPHIISPGLIQKIKLNPRYIEQDSIRQITEEDYNSIIQEAKESVPLDKLLYKTFIPLEDIQEWEKALEDKKQIIFYGPPGTGKTFLAKAFSEYLIEKYGGQSKLVQFHQSYSYEDFVEGIRPLVDKRKKTIYYQIMPGILKKISEDALNNPDKRYFLIIDEINRGQISRIFGELIYCMEYRGENIQLPYSKEEFALPQNLYLIGTMNTADRSIAFLNYALRRRFAFIECKPSEDVLKKWLIKNNQPDLNVGPIIRLFTKINDQIATDLSNDFKIGHTYFMLKPFTTKKFDIKWEYSIKPLLQEYFFNVQDKLEKYNDEYKKCHYELVESNTNAGASSSNVKSNNET